MPGNSLAASAGSVERVGGKVDRTRTKPSDLGGEGTGLPVALVRHPIGSDHQVGGTGGEALRAGCPYPVGIGGVGCPYPVVIGGGWQQVTNKDGEYTRWLVADIEYICPGTSRISTITGTIVNLHLRVGSTGAGDIAFEVGTGCTHRSGGQGIDGGGEGGDIEGEEDGILGSWVVGTELVVEAVRGRLHLRRRCYSSL